MIRLLATAVCVLTAEVLLAGDLDPPPGPIMPTNRTPIIPQKITSLPYVISTPGSYVLWGNIAAASYPGGPHGIVISASNVTLDLNGFALIGEGGLTNGIDVPGGAQSVAIRNGHIGGWHVGANLENAQNVILEGLRVTDNRSDGIRSGPRTLVNTVVAAGNEGDGVKVGHCSVLTESTASGNGGDGFSFRSGSNVSGCTANANCANGFFGEADTAPPDTGSTLTNCTALSNKARGFAPGSAALVRSCSAVLNASDGILAQTDCRIVGNLCDRNGDTESGPGDNAFCPSGGTFRAAGIRALGSRCRIEGNSITALEVDESEEDDFGIIVEAGVAKCLISGNSVMGFTTLTQSYNIIDPPSNMVGTIGSDPAAAGAWANFWAP